MTATTQIASDLVLARNQQRSQEHTLRMLGQNVTFAGYQWEDLLEGLRPNSVLAERITAMLAEASS